MSNFTIYTKENAPQASQALLADREKKYGFLPNLFGAFAGSPAVLEAYRLGQMSPSKQLISRRKIINISSTNGIINGIIFS